MSFRMLLCEERPLISAGIMAIFESAPGIEVAALARDLREVPGLVRELAPDAVLIGVPQVDSNVVSAIRDIIAQSAGFLRPNVLLLVEQDNDSYLRKAIQAGARGIVRTDTPVAELVRAVRDIASGHAVLPSAVTETLLAEATAHRSRHRSPAPPPVQLGTLTGRERLVLQLIARGMSDTEVAQCLRISVTTVRSHMHHLLTKLDLRGRTQAVAFGYRHGLVSARGASTKSGSLGDPCSTH